MARKSLGTAATNPSDAVTLAEVQALVSQAGFASTFLDASLGTGDGVVGRQGIGAAFSTISLPTKNNDPGNNFNTGSSFYTVPSTGTYLAIAKIRPADGQVTTQTNLGIGVHTANADHPSFQWTVRTTTGTGQNRNVYNYQRLSYFSAGDLLRFYAYSDGGSMQINTAQLTIQRIV